jgi:nucleoside-diphosphate-sugar epimerase
MGVTNNMLYGKTVLVTGASGFIGSHLCSHLLTHGAVVYGLSREFQEPNHVMWRKCDLRDAREVMDVVTEINPEIVYHLASYVTGSRDISAVLPSFYANLESTVNLLAAAEKIGIERFVTVGSLEEPNIEEGEFLPASPYGAAKMASTAYARMFHSLYGMPVVHLRLFMVYGPAQQDLQKLIPYVTLQALDGEPPRLTSGTREVDWIYVDDVVDAMLIAGVASGINGKTIDVGTGELETVAGIVRRLVAIANPDIKLEFGELGDRQAEVVRRADVEKSFSDLKWRSSIPLEDGLRRTVEWYSAARHNHTLGDKTMPWHDTAYTSTKPLVPSI